MASNPTSASPLFLREAEIRRGIELLFFGHGELMGSADALLGEQALGRAHHRALYFIARKPGLAVGDLIALLGITKQSLGRVLREIEERGLISRAPGREDRRQVLLGLTAKGEALEAALFDALREKMVAAYSEAGSGAISGFWTVLKELLPPDKQALASEIAKVER